MRLNEKYGVITGGAGGIGLAPAGRFLDEGTAAVMLVDLDEKALKEAASSLAPISDPSHHQTAGRKWPAVDRYRD